MQYSNHTLCHSVANSDFLEYQRWKKIGIFCWPTLKKVQLFAFSLSEKKVITSQIVRFSAKSTSLQLGNCMLNSNSFKNVFWKGTHNSEEACVYNMHVNVNSRASVMKITTIFLKKKNATRRTIVPTEDLQIKWWILFCCECVQLPWIKYYSLLLAFQFTLDTVRHRDLDIASNCRQCYKETQMIAKRRTYSKHYVILILEKNKVLSKSQENAALMPHF